MTRDHQPEADVGDAIEFHGELRCVLGRGLERDKPEIAEWLDQYCTPLAISGTALSQSTSRPRVASGVPGPDNALYDCGCGKSPWAASVTGVGRDRDAGTSEGSCHAEQSSTER